MEDRMECKIITEFPNYRIWENGKIESRYKFKTNLVCNTWRELQHILDKGVGYYVVTLSHGGLRKNKRVHRLLAEAFIPNPENKAHVNHIDGDKRNNALTNLEWTTERENARHAIQIGLVDLSRNHNREVIQINLETNTSIKEYISLHEASRATNIQWQNIWKVCNGQRRCAGGYAWSYK